MKRSSIFSQAAVLALALLAPAHVRANFVSWSYNWTPNTLSIPADASGTGGLSLTNELTKSADGTSDVVVTNIRAFSSAPRGTPDHITHGAYTFTLVLKDNASHQAATMKFTGFFSGSFSATSANIGNTFTGTSASAMLGGNTYVVTIGNYAPPGPPTASNAGSVSAHVAVNEIIPPPPPPPGHAPEPSTLLLSCMGLFGLGAASWKKWRRLT
jgi:hypothetical protein